MLVNYYDLTKRQNWWRFKRNNYICI